MSLAVSKSPGRGSPLAWWPRDMPFPPRAGQVATLERVADAWPWADVLVIRDPVGAGKSLEALTLAGWAGGATIATPTNKLVDQYQATVPGLAPCPRGQGARAPALPWLRDNPVRVLNYYQYLALKAYSECVVFDEAHRLVPTLQEMEAVTVWEHEAPLPGWVRSTTDLLVWAQSHPGVPKLARLAKALLRHPDSYQVSVGSDTWRGKERACVTLTPLTPRHNRPVLWPPSRVKKLVFMSATFHEEDLWDLGLEGRRVAVIDGASPIPRERRPVVYEPVGFLGRAGRDSSLGPLAAKLAELADRHAGTRGLVHTTYDLARQLRTGPLGADPRFVWHGPDNASRVLREWLDEGRRPGAPPRHLVACGMTEGLDLAGDLARWQAVTKVLYPSLADPAVAAKAAARPGWYHWVAARDIQQAVGRVSRGPDDYGVSYILDGAFGRLYSEHRDLFTPSFGESLVT